MILGEYRVQGEDMVKRKYTIQGEDIDQGSIVQEEDFDQGRIWTMGSKQQEDILLVILP